MMRRYNSFSQYASQRFGGKKIYKVNVDAGFTCPNRDGTLGFGGCVYCNNDSFRPEACKPALPIRQQIENGMEYLRRRYGAELFLAYFQPFTNTYAPVDTLQKYYREALEVPLVAGLAIGTRPDCVDSEKISLLQDIARTKFVLVEYGLQSIYDKSLRFINRGHDFSRFFEAVRATAGGEVEIGAHIIAGFPTETSEETLAMAGALSETGIRFLKIHQLQIVKGTKLANMFAQNPFHVFGYDEYVSFVVDFLERLSPEIVIQRLFATAPDDILIAPRWDSDRHRLLRDIEGELERRGSFQGEKFSAK
ncbi:MAG: TIGR01212 family radical SAM protein [Actinomycetota bacterium]|nr:TIGR01212 family radical SAM protein [Actinomycetota bacterium]